MNDSSPGNIDKSKGLAIGWEKEKHRERIHDRGGKCWDKFYQAGISFHWLQEAFIRGYLWDEVK